MHDEANIRTQNLRIDLPLTGMILDLGKGDLRDANGERVELRPQAFQVLCFLAQNAGRVVTKDELHQAVWPDTIVTDDSLVQAVGDLRRVLSDADHNIIKTVPRRGYEMVADAVSHPDKPEGSAEQVAPPVTLPTIPKGRTRTWGMLAIPLVAVALVAKLDWSGERSVQQVDLAAGTPSLSITVESSDSAGNSLVSDGILPELRVALSRYRTVQLSDKPEPGYQLRLTPPGINATKARLTVELIDNSDASLVFAETYEIPQSRDAAHNIGVRVAAAIASPGVGAVGRHLISTSRLKPVEELTPAECYAHGFGCSKCSGEEDNITKRAEACLANIIEQNPEDSRAWALQATIYAHQYWWGNTLIEPQRSNLELRGGLIPKAIEAANKSEALVDSGVAEVQQITAREAISRALQMDPDYAYLYPAGC